MKSAKKGHKQHTWESVKLLCSLNSTIHLTNRLFFLSFFSTIFFPCLPSSFFREVSYEEFLEFDALALATDLV